MIKLIKASEWILIIRNILEFDNLSNEITKDTRFAAADLIYKEL